MHTKTYKGRFRVANAGKYRGDITNIVYRNLKNGQTYSISYNEIIEKIKNCNWVAKKGGIHLKDQNGKTYFHFQREGKKNKNNSVDDIILKYFALQEEEKESIRNYVKNFSGPTIAKKEEN
jgi:hypothetical protein